MKKNYKYWFLLGVILYFVFNVGLQIPRMITILIALGITLLEFIFLQFYKMKLNADNLNKFVDMTDKSVEKIIKETKESQIQIHDIKNNLLIIKDCVEKNELNLAKKEIDTALIECTKNMRTPICSNIYVDSFLSKFITDHKELEYDIKINVPENIHMKTMDLCSFILCFLKDELIKKEGMLTFHMHANENELVTNVIYPNEVFKQYEDNEMILNAIVKKYHGKLVVNKDKIQCILFFYRGCREDS